ncbi:MAG: signal recognition particle protein, partial [Candidatus Cloacimonetes bacterium]|nr:signal recognition particle protein [Candidatus Cloacimonadota bacterium]
RLTKVMLVGLQGSGKTTACAKLANFYRKKKVRPMMVACDIYRPAAVHQLQVLGKQLDIPVIYDDSNEVTRIADKALKEATREMTNLLIFDTAGRLHVDEAMMDEIYKLKQQIKPDYILFVADSMTGQDAVTVAKQFNDKMDFSGVILTKLDGDARGGAALSIKAVTGKPVIFVGMGEKVSDLELFHADRMASRILGMGDVLSLIEKAEEAFDEAEAEKLAKKMKKNEFDLNDFLNQLQHIKKLGPLDSILKMIPGVNAKAMQGAKIDEKQLAHIEAIIKSMTTREREKPQILNGSRRKRIAIGSGRSVQEVNKLLRNFEDMKKMMKKMNNPKFAKQFQNLQM